MSRWGAVYGRLPAPARSLAASLRGYQLSSWRYGPETDRLVEEALEREHWGEGQWKTWQEDRLARLLHRAATRVPYYREQWAERRRRGDRASWERLENWPVLTKAPLRENPEAFVADDCDLRTMSPAETSGTTGTPLWLCRSRSAERLWYAIFEARLRLWNGVSRRDCWANIGGQRVTPGAQRKPPFWVWNRGMRQLYLSSYHVTPDAVPFYLDAIRRYGVTYLLGYPSAMHAVARVALERNLPAPRLRVVLSNAESLSDFQREAIGAAFDCPVRNTYGQAEIVCAASECPSGAMHLWPDVGVTEWLRDDSDQEVPRGHVGRLVCTGLINLDMPLVRYAVGDRAALSETAGPCACGRLLPIIQSLDGRAQDVILTPSGSPVGGLDTVFHSGIPMLEGQIVQETLCRIRIKVVPAPGFGPRHQAELIRGIQDRIGNEVEVVVDEVPSILRTSAGKFQLQMSLIAESRRSASETSGLLDKGGVPSKTPLVLMLEGQGYPFRRALADLASVSGLNPDERSAWQTERRWEIARFHAERNPVYRSLVADGALPAQWEALPIVTKALFQRPLRESLSEGYPAERVHRSSTSGSSGEPFFFARDKYTHARTWALIARRYGWHQIRLNSRQARFYGIPLEFWPRLREVAKDKVMNRVRFPVFDLSDAALQAFRKRIAREDFEYLYGYTNSLSAFARYLLRIGVNLGAECPTLRACIVTSEMCAPAERRVLEEAFGVPVINEYGASETGVIAFEDTGGSWRLSWENLYVEVVTDEGLPAPEGEPGHILVTDLFNRAMPFIRYRIGDVGVVREGRGSGREPELVSLEGRVNDTIVLPSGRKAAGLTFYYIARSLLAGSGAPREFVIRQTAIDEFVFDVVSDAPLTDRDVRTIQEKMALYLEPGLRLRINLVPEIPRSASGKRKHFYSELPSVPAPVSIPAGDRR